MQELTVACVYVPGNGFNIDYVQRLYDGFKMQKVPHRFVCLTTDINVTNIVGVENTILLRGNLFGWWNKIELFHPTFLTGRVLYCDLDCVITGDLSELMLYDGKEPLFLDDFYYPENLASGIMSFIAEDMHFVWYRFTANKDRVIKECDAGRFSNRGDQGFLRTLFRTGTWNKVQKVQNGIYSYKVHIAGKVQRPNDMAMIMFHGNPRPHEVQL